MVYFTVFDFFDSCGRYGGFNNVKVKVKENFWLGDGPFKDIQTSVVFSLFMLNFKPSSHLYKIKGRLYILLYKIGQDFLNRQ